METNKCLKRLLSLMLCLMVTAGMCFSFSFSAYADETGTSPAMPAAELSDPIVLNNGAAVELVESANSDSAPVYRTPALTKSGEEFTYNFSMPKKGTLVIQYGTTSADTSCYVNPVSGASNPNNVTGDSVQTKLFPVPSAGNVSLKFTVYDSTKAGAAVFTAWYAPDRKSSVKSGKEFMLGSTGSDASSSFTIKAPSNGYITVDAVNAVYPSFTVRMKAKGFKDYEYPSSSNGNIFNIGVKKGTYTISLKTSGASIYNVKATFHRVKETSAKTSKAKAASIKKKSANKGIIPVNNRKKVHWYKIKNPKNQKMTLAVNTKKMSNGGSYSAKLKITVYFPDKKSRYTTISTGYSNSFSVTYGTIGTKKARKGTYYVKVQSLDGANGYYTLKWK